MPMRDKELYAQILGIKSPWQVSRVELTLSAGEVTVHVEQEPDARQYCPICAKVSPGYDSRSRRWRHLDTCQYKTILVAEAPRVKCQEHGVVTVAVPWAVRCRLDPIKAVAKTIKAHLWGILNAIVLKVSNGPAEGLNSRIKTLKVRSRGFRNRERFANAIYFHFGGLDLYPEGVVR